MSSDAVHPFTLAISDDDIHDLRDRLARTRWPEPLPGRPWARGVPVAYLRGLADYWRDGYDWRVAEGRFNALPQFTTTIDGATIYFQHIRSTHDGALPLLLCHGWPGSVAEFRDIIELLTQPERHGDDAADAFHLVIPAIPGFPLSSPLPDEGWTSERVAAAFVELMTRLGYDRFGAQGGDLGAIVCPAMGQVAPDRVVGVHVNAATMGFIPWGEVPEDEQAQLTDLERERLGRLGNWMKEESGYMQIQGTKPETLGYGMTDSPAALLAWIVEKFHGWTAFDRELPEDAVDRDHLLTDVSLYWFTGAMPSAMNNYYEGQHAAADWDSGDESGDDSSDDVGTDGDWSGGDDAAKGVPTGVAVFRNEVAMRHWGEQSNNITYWRDFDSGGHFAAMETPDLLVGEIRTFFRTVR